MAEKKTGVMEERLRKLGSRLDGILAQAQKTKDFARKINVEEILRQKKTVEKKLKEFKGPARAAWKEIESGMNSALRELGAALVRAKDRLKE